MTINNRERNGVKFFLLCLVGLVHPLANSGGLQQINSLKHESEATFYQDLTSYLCESDIV